jgi:hypothetical protein
LLQRRREGTGGDFAFALGGDDLLVAAQHALVEQDQAEELLLLAVGGQGGLADEIALVLQATVHARPASSGDTVSSMSWP